MRRYRLWIRILCFMSVMVNIIWLTWTVSNLNPHTNKEVYGLNKPEFQICPNTSVSTDIIYSPSVILQKCANIQIYPYAFVMLKNVVINPTKAKSKKGGEDLTNVIGQIADEEELRPKPGYFRIKCDFENFKEVTNEHSVFLNNMTRLWMQVVARQDGMLMFNETENTLTIAVHRIEYANLYHAMTEWYNVFLVAYVFRKLINCQINVLFLDGHPYSDLDLTWSTLFGKVTRASFIRQPTLYRYLILGLAGNNSPLNDHKSKSLPMAESFRNFFLQKHGFTETLTKNCNHLNILFIWRHNYVAHPRNPSGKIKRKIKNEFELLENARRFFPDHNIHGRQMDKLNLKAQLNLISKTNILIGMHGAGMSHVFFLEPGSGVIELFPKYALPSNIHFKAMSRWRKLFYTSWQNVQTWNEFDDGSTYIQPSVIKYLIRRKIAKICN
ncbi:glycoprotein 2-beta-D-xylosyltransferase [Mytilus galloprovincialis]|uniref:EGF domain-specific O-linked N-acetylglucosamine transferase n=1 Tax=Mytilus galloprovincialis TaxID=29158 RepID=A0A8B6CQN2_MYTGA|nr:glycoprotein 2-beta-D-xylosyltransferase [Mytilus galloprovincialis]